MNCNAFVFGRMMWLPLGAGIDLPQIPDTHFRGHAGRWRGASRREHLSPWGSAAAAAPTRPSLEDCAAGKHRHQTNGRDSIVFGALTDPRTNGISVADRQLLLTVRHTHLRGGAPIEKPHQVAAIRVTGDDHRAELGALHQPLIGREVEPAFFVTRAAALVAAHTSACEDGQYVLGEALRFRRA